MTFILGLIVGGLATWTWRDRIREILGNKLDVATEVGADASAASATAGRLSGTSTASRVGPQGARP
jgi:hypothetical protein